MHGMHVATNGTVAR